MRKSAITILIVFITCQIASIAILVLWIVWSTTSNTDKWWLFQGIILMVPIIGGSTLIFVYWTKSRLLDAERVNFISSVSHELLTPLASFRMYVETLQMRRLPEERQQEFLQVMLEESDRLAASIASILNASRIERGKDLYRFEQIDVGEMVKRFIEGNALLLKNVTVTMNCERDIKAMIDEGAFNTVLRNLVDNAVRYSPPPPHITFTLKRFKQRLLLSLEDHGIGVDPRKMKYVFKLFTRASNNPSGTGIGLYISKKIIKAHKGKIWLVNRQEGTGLTVSISMPIIKLKG